MTEISAQMVKALRDATGCGMMECKRALAACDGDAAAARDYLRVKGGARAEKAATRAAAAGVVACAIRDGVGALTEVNCETDFVARHPDFAAFAARAAEAAAVAGESDPVKIGALDAGGESVEEARRALVMKVGENVALSRCAVLRGELFSYIHHGAQIGALAAMENGQTVGREICMHIAAARPRVISPADAPADWVAKEREIAFAAAKEEGKPDDIAEKVAAGRAAKFASSIALAAQPFVKEPKKTVGETLKEAGAAVRAFAVLAVGEEAR